MRNRKGQFIKGHKGYKFWKGKSFSKEHKIKLSISHKDKPNGRLGYKTPKETREKIRIAHIGKLIGNENPAKRLEVRIKISKANSGKNHYLWKGGITPLRQKLRQCWKFKQWREEIFKRDNWTCQITGQKGRELHPHHIVDFASILNEIKYAYLDGKITFEKAINYDFLWDIDNGITLSKKNHKQIHNY